MSVAVTVNGRTHEPIDAIAREHLGLKTLATRGSDALDMRTQAVWCIRAALAAAYEAGRAEGNETAKLYKGQRDAARDMYRDDMGTGCHPVDWGDP